MNPPKDALYRRAVVVAKSMLDAGLVHTSPRIKREGSQAFVIFYEEGRDTRFRLLQKSFVYAWPRSWISWVDDSIKVSVHFSSESQQPEHN